MEQKNKNKIILILIVITILAILVIGYLFLISNNAPNYERVGPITSRLSSEPILLRELIRPGEKIARNIDFIDPIVEGSPSEGEKILSQEVYCAFNIADKVEEISERTNTYTYKGNEDLVSIEDFKSYLSENMASCVWVRGAEKEFYDTDKVLVWDLTAEGMNIYISK